MKLCSYSNESLEVLGQNEATVQYNEQTAYSTSNCGEREWAVYLGDNGFVTYILTGRES